MSVLVNFKTECKQNSEYDWFNFEFCNVRVGKSRCRICPNESCPGRTMIVIHNINIYPEWQGRGFGRHFIEYCKSNFDVIIADRVRAAAVGFQESMGFCRDSHGNYIYCEN